MIFIFKEANNLKNRNTFRLNGLIHPKIVGVEAVKDGKGVVLTTGSVKSRMTCFFVCSQVIIHLFRCQKTS